MKRFVIGVAIFGLVISAGCSSDAKSRTVELKRLCEQAIKRDLDNPDNFLVIETRDYRVRDGGYGIIIKYRASGASIVTGGTPVTTCTSPQGVTPTLSNMNVLKDFDPYRYR
ncbi:hypothetical protein DN062_18235 [Nitrincola tibetensis]|uniref:Lipoprotein n=1 Tax=Nitrincola tibetensis TaxID=2219697 RepID=A0A364NHE2_9GAMM|nr:hypothetical protein [Nitrincola tibetensis]RAU16431.1 hypothetical protein DN062_18235 [Nitrincola tibetensis]